MEAMNDPVKQFTQAAGELLDQALRATDPQTVAGLEKVAQAGGMLTVKATFAPSTGLAQIFIEVASPSGEVVNLMSCELRQNAP